MILDRDDAEARRAGRFAYEESRLTVLEAMNDALAELNEELRLGCGDEPLPSLFVTGLPRSGTTLFYQLLFNCLDVGCINNLAARFWRAPLVGLLFAEDVCGSRKPLDFRSDFGKADSIESPHEFSWFWHDRLGIGRIAENWDYASLKECVPWSRLASELNAMTMVTGRPMVHKPLEFAGYFADKLSASMAQCFFLEIERDPLDVACSIAGGRLDYYGDYAHWFGSYIPHYRDLLDQSCERQIAQQIKTLQATYAEARRVVPPERHLVISYEALCASPGRVLDQVIELIRGASGVNIDKIHEPEPFIPAGRSGCPPQLERALGDELAAVGVLRPA